MPPPLFFLFFCPLCCGTRYRRPRPTSGGRNPPSRCSPAPTRCLDRRRRGTSRSASGSASHTTRPWSSSRSRRSGRPLWFAPSTTRCATEARTQASSARSKKQTARFVCQEHLPRCPLMLPHGAPPWPGRGCSARLQSGRVPRGGLKRSQRGDILSRAAAQPHAVAAVVTPDLRGVCGDWQRLDVNKAEGACRFF